MRPLCLPLLFKDHFEADQYEEISQKYFGSLRSKGALYADPSGWIDTFSEAAPNLPSIHTEKEHYGRYYLDVGRTLQPDKAVLTDLLSLWEGCRVEEETVTLCPSVSAASLLVLGLLQTLNVKSLVFETPCYFATADQAEYFGFQRHFIPTYLSDQFRVEEIAQILEGDDHLALWITQPRASLGLDQDSEQLKDWLSRLNASSYLIVDEATDQSFPAVLGRLRDHPNASRLIKLKNFSKPMGLNGLRIAAVLHDATLRNSFTSLIETFGGSIDVHSLKTVVQLAGDVERFQSMFRVVNEQVVKLRIQADRLVQGTSLTVIPLANGYIGTIALPIARTKQTFLKGRDRFLAYCRDKRTPVILGPSMYMASDWPTEHVRMNYLSHPQHILRAMEVLSDFSVE